MKLRPPALVALALVLLLQGSCSMMRRMTGAGKCREPEVPAAANRAPLKVPAGLDAPDTRNAVRVPELGAAEAPRGKTDPCLSQPPSYGS